jgi:four helix bundle protein
MPVRRHEDLLAWQLGTELRRRILAITAREAVRRDLRFCEQLRAAGASVTANIAEGYGRFNRREMALFLRYSRGSIFEAKDRLLDGLDRGHFTRTEYDEILLLIQRTTAAITQLIRSLGPPGP